MPIWACSPHAVMAKGWAHQQARACGYFFQSRFTHSTDTGPLHSKRHEAYTVVHGQLFLACFVNMFTKQGIDRCPRTLDIQACHCYVCVHREPMIFVIVIERKRKRGARERERRKREREKGRERREPHLSLPSACGCSNVSVCRLKHFRHTRKRFKPTHGFSACQAAAHTTPHTTQHTTQHAHNTHHTIIHQNTTRTFPDTLNSHTLNSHTHSTHTHTTRHDTCTHTTFAPNISHNTHECLDTCTIDNGT